MAVLRIRKPTTARDHQLSLAQRSNISSLPPPDGFHSNLTTTFIDNTTYVRIGIARASTFDLRPLELLACPLYWFSIRDRLGSRRNHTWCWDGSITLAVELLCRFVCQGGIDNHCHQTRSHLQSCTFISFSFPKIVHCHQSYLL
jgi:hypothetical protein